MAWFLHDLNRIAKIEHMKIKLLFVGLCALFILGSCEKDGLTYTERRVLGDWTYTKVKYTRNWSVDPTDLTSDYNQFTITFNSDFSATYVDAETGESFSGIWDLIEDYDGENCTSDIYASFNREVTGELFHVIFQNISVTKQKLRANYMDNDGRFRYVLSR